MTLVKKLTLNSRGNIIVVYISNEFTDESYICTLIRTLM